MSPNHSSHSLISVKQAARQIRSSWSDREKNLRRRLARLRTQAILQLLQTSLATAN